VSAYHPPRPGELVAVMPPAVQVLQSVAPRRSLALATLATVAGITGRCSSYSPVTVVERWWQPYEPPPWPHGLAKPADFADTPASCVEALVAAGELRVSVDDDGRPSGYIVVHVAWRVLARSHRALEAPPWHVANGAAPNRPIKAWSQLALQVPPDRLVLRNGTPAWPGVRVEGEVLPIGGGRRPMHRQRIVLVDGWRWPTWTDVARAALVEARNVEGAEAIVSPLELWPDLGWAACAWCGQAEVRRADWMLIGDRPWCGIPSDCPRPNVGVPAVNRATAAFVLTEQPMDALLVDQLYRDGRLPKPLLWSDLPDDERVPYAGPWGWWSDDDVDALEAVLEQAAAPNDEHVAEALRRGRADMEAADHAEAVRQAEFDRIMEAARAEANKTAARVNRIRADLAEPAPPAPTANDQRPAAPKRRPPKNRPAPITELLRAQERRDQAGLANMARRRKAQR
jgi:hypothetical protein